MLPNFLKLFSCFKKIAAINNLFKYINTCITCIDKRVNSPG